MTTLTRTALAIDRDLLKRFDKWMARRGYTNRSQAVRDLIRSALVQQQWQRPSAKVVATLSVIYDHERHELAQQLTHLQHGDHRAIMCSQHLHLDSRNCLEVVVMQGTARQLRRLADAITSTRGVRAGKLTMLSRDM